MFKTILVIAVGVLVGSSQAIAAASCSDNAVIDVFLDQYVCGVLANCSVIGRNYGQLKSTGDEELRGLVGKLLVDAEPSSLRNIRNPSAEMYLSYLETTIFNEYRGARTVIRSASAIPVDYNSNIKRYKCQVTLQYDNDSLLATSTAAALLGATLDERFSSMLWLAVQENKETAVRLQINIIQRLATWEVSRVRRTGFFYVQPKDLDLPVSSYFVVSFDYTTLLDWSGVAPASQSTIMSAVGRL